MIPIEMYYFDARDRYIRVLLLNKVSENRKGFTWRDYDGGSRGAASDASAGVPVGAVIWEYGTFKHDCKLSWNL